MRPVNLIPPEERRGDHAPLRAGSLSYIVVATIGAALVAVVALVLTQNTITERQDEIERLEVTRDAAVQRAEALAPYAEFASVQEQREATITMLAESRFDWERVLRELALVVPGGITLDNLDASTVGQASGSTGEAAPVPTLLMTGCAPGHDVVAEFVAALEDIDGVTRVGLDNSVEREQADGAATPTAPGTEGERCGTDPGVVDFSATAVFDGVAIAAAAAGTTPSTPTAPAAPAAPAEPAAPPTEQAAAQTNSTEEQVAESSEAANLVPGTMR
jgi:Tfp pilus assembly protein PilN